MGWKEIGKKSQNPMKRSTKQNQIPAKVSNSKLRSYWNQTEPCSEKKRKKETKERNQVEP